MRKSLTWWSTQWFKFAQNLSQTLLAPIAILPAAGVMLGLASSLQDYLPLEFAELLRNVGNFAFLIMPMLFAVAITTGFCKEPGTAALTSVFGYGVFTSSMTVLTGQQIDLQSTAILDNQMLDTGIAGGMVMGLMSCLAMYLSQFVRLPQMFSFFEGRRSAPMLILPLAMVVAWGFSCIWPSLAEHIDKIANWAVYQRPAWAFALYATVERLLLPLGLHHIWNTPFFLEFGQYVHQGEVVRGEVARYLAGDPLAGNLAGGYLIKMWGLPAAAIAILRSANPSERNRIAGVMLSAAATSWLTGVTEPIEFAFLFVAPVLYLVHALLCGLAYMICVMLGIHYGVTFSQGLIDLVLLWHNSSNSGWFLILGPMTALIYYALFTSSIRIFNLKTPGRLESFEMPAASASERPALLINALGGITNIEHMKACMTRIRLSVHTPENVDKRKLLALGAKGVIVLGHGVQVVFGTQAESVRQQMQSHIDASSV
ncbi:PTS glucose-specific subunit IIBC [Shewanella mangrovi]|uniref:PTS glucose-specific subunit IIBC n=1 Tax=Shewanella mangrovi TaxID=1515746 RepID=A0A094JGM7_9GAMM|nr:PTS transporter subunit EIIC [Shewanella mangrovi]KFZ37189.1 PTS glucose-specific subunit IIBC [Shewanella mangrovi]